MSKKHSELLRNMERLEGGLEKLKSTSAQVCTFYMYSTYTCICTMYMYMYSTYTCICTMYMYIVHCTVPIHVCTWLIVCTCFSIFSKGNESDIIHKINSQSTLYMYIYRNDTTLNIELLIQHMYQYILTAYCKLCVHCR